ncbi:MarR family transcriptional regulator [Natronobiforma cellulositropha]|uniref:MarR family transcriptional regulator n=1 Tax=Natronobiforma cellulositropha TaxID=1679076 RepID=UPI0021D5CB00|nr:helix-turn-helix domain-containing protein [Natronobiforma cellulositropha]
MSNSNNVPQKAADTDETPFRETYPSGWLALTKNDSVCMMVDALLDFPPYREFNQTELARMSNVSRQSVNRHIDLLAGLGIIELVEGTSPRRYRFDAENPISEALIRLDGAISNVDEKPSSTSTPPSVG